MKKQPGLFICCWLYNNLPQTICGQQSLLVLFIAIRY